MKQFFLFLIVFFPISFVYVPLSAQIGGGQISLDASYNTTFAQTCLNYCNPNYSNCYNRVYNYTPPTGGSGQYQYSWERKVGAGAWTRVTGYPYADTSFLTPVPPPSIKGEKFYYRRKVKDRLNPSDSAYSNSVYLTTYVIYHGNVEFIDGFDTKTVPTGTQPPQLRNVNSYTDNTWDSWIFWLYKVGASGYWQDAGTYHLPNPGPNSTYYLQPATRTTPDTVYYRSYIENSCSDYDTTYSSTAVLIFTNPITFSPGTISANGYTACPGTPISLKTTATTAPSPYLSTIEYSKDSTNWLDRCSNCDSVVDNAFTQTTYYRRKVTSQNSTYFSNVIKVTAGGIVGDTAVFGMNRWNFYGYNGSNVNNPTYNNYVGYYTNDSLDIDTRMSWADTASPSSAPGYLGCPIKKDNFVLIAKRQGFDTGTYQIVIPGQKGLMRIIKDGVVLYNLSCCNTGSTRLDLGKLGSMSRVEVRFGAGSGATPLVIDFVRVGLRLSSFANADCNKFWIDRLKSNDLVSLLDSSGAPVLAVNSRNQSFGYLGSWMKHTPPGPANIPVDSNGFHYMPRYFKFESSYGNQTFSPIMLRLYYLNSEFDDYKLATNKPNLTANDLSVLHYKGVNEDCNTNNNTSYGSIVTPIATGPFGSDAFYVDVEVNSFSEFGVTADASSLPVSFINLNAKNAGNDIEINWEIAEGLKEGHFDILRSYDGITFSKITNLPASSSTILTRFSYVDRTVSSTVEQVFYKIKQTDRNGKYAFSSVAKVKLARHTITAHPNPAHNSTTIRSSVIVKHVSITDLRGRVIKSINCNSTVVPVSLSSMPQGMYLLKTTLMSGESKVVRITRE